MNKIRSFFSDFFRECFRDPFWNGFFSVFTFGQTGIEPLAIESPHLKELPHIKDYHQLKDSYQLAIVWKKTWLTEKALLDKKKDTKEINNEQYDHCMEIINEELIRLDNLIVSLTKQMEG